MAWNSYKLLQCIFSNDWLNNDSGWGWGVSVMATTLLSFMFLDVIKVIIIKRWSFELTAKLWPVPSRKEKLRVREAQKVIQKRVKRNVEKVRKVLRLVTVLVAWPRPGQKKGIKAPPSAITY